MNDRYEKVSVHGLYPLIVDAQTRSLRFARLEQDRPEDCVTSPDELPDVLARLFVFENEGMLRAWAHGVETVAGNAASVDVPDARTARVALLLNHDQSRADGRTLEECISMEVVGYRHDERHPRHQIAADRKSEIERRVRDAGKNAFSEHWAAEIAAANTSGIANASVESFAKVSVGDPLELRVRDSPTERYRMTFAVVRSGDGYEASWDATSFALDEDLHKCVVAKAEGLGARTIDGSRTVVTPLSSFSREDIERLVEVHDAYDDLVEKAGLEDAGRRLVTVYAMHKKLFDALRRLDAGFPLVAYGWTAEQAAPRTGRGSEFPSSQLGRARGGGLVECLWAKDIGRTTIQVFGITPAGRALISKDPYEHAALIERARQSVDHRAAQSEKGLHEDLSTALPVRTGASVKTIEALSNELDGAITDVVRHNSYGWATVMAAIHHGLAELGEDGRPRRKA